MQPVVPILAMFLMMVLPRVASAIASIRLYCFLSLLPMFKTLLEIQGHEWLSCSLEFRPRECLSVF